MSFFGLGGGGIKIQIDLHASPEGLESGSIVPLDHVPSWKIRKNPFLALKRPTNPFQNDQITQNGNGFHDDNASVVSDITSHTHAQGARDYQVAHQPPESLGMMRSSDTTYVYEGTQNVEGEVSLFLPPGKRVEHLGIKVQFLGTIDMTHAVHEGRPHYDFISLVKELQPPGVLFQNKTTIPFHFRNVEKQHETYHGRNVSVKYLVRVLIERKFFPRITKEKEVLVQLRGQEPSINEAIKMEVGIEECLHIEFEYEKRCYHLKDVILGKINFLLVRIKIKYMELAVIRRETSGDGVAFSAMQGGGTSPTSGDGNGNILTETQTLTKFEIMDGAPVKGETIPVTLHINGIPADLTPTYNCLNNRFAVRYFLNLVLVDEEDRRYFKQQEIILWRKELG